MRVPHNLKAQYTIISDEGIDIQGLFYNFSSSQKERLLRKYIAPLLRFFPTGIRYWITDIAKHLRNPSRAVQLHYPLDFPENQRIAARLKKSNSAPWWKKKAVLCLSHDVDNDEGYSFVPIMAAMDREAGIPSTFNFLTHDNYRLDAKLLNELEKDGFEIGLHGYTHDQGFSFRSPSVMNKKLDSALERLKGYEIMGTRSPALSKSDEFFKAIARAGIKYDSTMQIGSGIYASVRLPYPYYYERYNIWEFPLMIQDDNYLRDAVVDEDFIIESLKKFIEQTITLNGIMVLNMHPHLMKDRVPLYATILSSLNEYRKTVAFKTTGDVYTVLESKR